MDRVALRRVGRNVLALYASRAAIVLVPLITIPILARVLQPDALAVMFIAQALGMWSAMIIEYGFQLSATRDISRQRDHPDKVAEIVNDVIAAQCLLVAATAVLAFGATMAIPALRADPALGLLAWLIGVGAGLMPRWYFVGKERMRLLVALEVASRMVVLALIVLLIDGPEDVWLVLAIYAFPPLAATAAAFVKLYSEVVWHRPRLGAGVGALRTGVNMFLYVASDSLFVTANTFLLGIFAPLRQVSFFRAVERFTTAGLGLLDPILEAVFPYQSKLITEDRDQAKKVVRLALAVVGGGALVGGLLLALLAPWIIAILLGPGYEGAVPVMRILAISVPITAIGNVLGYHWMLPMGLDRSFLIVLIFAGVVNVSVVAMVAGPFGAVGVAGSVVLAETLIVVGFFVVLSRRGLNPLGAKLAAT